MNWIWFATLAGVWVAGMAIGAFALQIPIIFFFGFPYANQLKRDGMLRDNRPFVRLWISAAVISCILAALAWAVVVWIPGWVIPLCCGFAFIWLLGVRHCGKNPKNVEDFLRNNAGSIHKRLWIYLSKPRMPANLQRLAELALVAEQKAEEALVAYIEESEVKVNLHLTPKSLRTLARDPWNYSADTIRRAAEREGDHELADFAKSVPIDQLRDELQRRYGG